MKERQPEEMIRRRRLGLTALSSPALVGFYSEVGIPLANSLGLRSGLAIREITSTAGCLLTLPGPRLASSNGREHAMRIGFPGTGTAGRHLRPEVAGPEHEVPPEPDMMDQDTAELAYRRGAGIEVTLLWHRTSGALMVSVTDAAQGASFELPVAADEALAAFHHPYAYAAAQGVAY